MDNIFPNLTTIILTNLTDKHPYSVTAAAAVTSSNDSVTDREAEYDRRADAHGAMLFTIATVCVYGLSIIAFIAGHLKRRHHLHRDEERQIEQYLKDKHRDLPFEDNKFHVLRYKSNLLAISALGQRHDHRISLIHPRGLRRPGRCGPPIGSLMETGEAEEEEVSEPETDSPTQKFFNWNCTEQRRRNSHDSASGAEGRDSAEHDDLPESKTAEKRAAEPSEIAGHGTFSGFQDAGRYIERNSSAETDDEVFVTDDQTSGNCIQLKELSSAREGRRRKMNMFVHREALPCIDNRTMKEEGLAPESHRPDGMWGDAESQLTDVKEAPPDTQDETEAEDTPSTEGNPHTNQPGSAAETQHRVRFAGCEVPKMIGGRRTTGCDQFP